MWRDLKRGWRCRQSRRSCRRRKEDRGRETKKQIAAGEVVEIIAGVGFMGLPLGSTVDEMQEIFGRASKIARTSSGGEGHTYWPDDAPISRALGRPDNSHMLVFDSAKKLSQVDVSCDYEGRVAFPVRTGRGIALHSHEAVVRAAYGAPTKDTKGEGKYDHIFYLKYEQYGITFHFLDNKVVIIGVERVGAAVTPSGPHTPATGSSSGPTKRGSGARIGAKNEIW